MVDIDARVIDVAKEFLPEWSDGAFDDPRAEVIVGDALEFMRERHDRYGVILSDLTEPLEDSPSNPLFNDDVFALIKSRLADGGIYALQASTAARAQRLAALQDGAHAAPPLRARRLVLYARAGLRHRLGLLGLQRPRRSGAPRRQDHRCLLRGACAAKASFTTAETHRRLFSLPLYLRRMLAAGGDTF